MRPFCVLFLVAGFLSAVCLAGNHPSKAPWSDNSSSNLSRGDSQAAAVSPKDCLPIAEAAKHIRKQACVTGTVIRVEEGSNGVTFLDFCADYRSCPFTVVVFPADMRRLGDVRQLQGQVVNIQGRIEEYDDRAEIVLHRAQQLGENGKLLTAIPKEYDVEKRGHFSAGTFRAAKTKKAVRKAQGPPVSIVDAEDP